MSVEKTFEYAESSYCDLDSDSGVSVEKTRRIQIIHGLRPKGALCVWCFGGSCRQVGNPGIQLIVYVQKCGNRLFDRVLNCCGWYPN